MNKLRHFPHSIVYIEFTLIFRIILPENFLPAPILFLS